MILLVFIYTLAVSKYVGEYIKKLLPVNCKEFFPNIIEVFKLKYSRLENVEKLVKNKH